VVPIGQILNIFYPLSLSLHTRNGGSRPPPSLLRSSPRLGHSGLLLPPWSPIPPSISICLRQWQAGPFPSSSAGEAVILPYSHYRPSCAPDSPVRWGVGCWSPSFDVLQLTIAWTSSIGGWAQRKAWGGLATVQHGDDSIGLLLRLQYHSGSLMAFYCSLHGAENFILYLSHLSLRANSNALNTCALGSMFTHMYWLSKYQTAVPNECKVVTLLHDRISLS
jgi:hypothetical protein